MENTNWSSQMGSDFSGAAVKNMTSAGKNRGAKRHGALRKLVCGSVLAATLLPLGGCGLFGPNAGQDALLGGGLGATIGSMIGGLSDGPQGSWLGAMLGGAIGAGAGAAIGSQIDQQQAALEQQLQQVPQLNYQPGNYYQPGAYQQPQVSVQSVQDSNNLKAIRLMLPDNILFAQGSSELTPVACSTLYRVAYNLNQFPGTDATIVGYTDNVGSEAQNQALSQQRADVVMNYLIGQGVAPQRLKAYGAGGSHPVANNDTPEGQAQNRRVDIFITAGEQMIQNAQN